MSDRPRVESATIWFDGYPAGHELYGAAVRTSYHDLDDGNGPRAWPAALLEGKTTTIPRRVGVSLTTGHLLVEVIEGLTVSISPDGFADAYHVARNANGEYRGT